MSRSEMLRTIELEMAHIPCGPKGSPQNGFRRVYHNAREHNLGKHADFPDSRSQTMKQSLELSAKLYANVKVLYDKQFFGDCG